MAQHSHDGSDPICKALLQFFVIVFLSILLLNSIDLTDSPMSLTYFPSVTRENEPFMVNALVRNPDFDSHRYTVNLFIDGALASSTEMLVDAISMQTSTLTIPSPKLGSAVRIHAEILDEETGLRYRESLLVPQSPPEAWMSFAAFSSLTSILLSSSSSSSALSSSFTISYYKSAVGLEAQSSALTINVGLIMSVLLVMLLLFIELSDSVFGSVEKRVLRMRGLYSLLAANLLLIFLGLVLTRTAMIIQG